MSSSAAVIGNNHHLLSTFLAFFPAKSLMALQFVSKQWRSIISSASFRRLHTLRHHHPNQQASFILRFNNTTKFLICNPTTKTLVPFLFEPLQSRYSHIKILQSCNGLLLLECFNVESQLGKEYNYHVYNPTTMQSRNLDLAKPFLGLCLVFDPCKSLYYRVVCFVKCTGSTLFTKVYDSATHKWKDIETSNESDNKLHEGGVTSCPIYWNHGIYFAKPHLFRSRLFYREDGLGNTVVDPPRGSVMYLTVESNGHMYGVQLHSIWLRLLELSKDDFRWSMLCRVRLNLIISESHDGKRIHFLGLIRGVRQGDFTLLFQVPGKIMICNLAAAAATTTFETLVDFRSESYYKQGMFFEYGFKGVHQLIHTLSPV